VVTTYTNHYLYNIRITLFVDDVLTHKDLRPLWGDLCPEGREDTPFQPRFSARGWVFREGRRRRRLPSLLSLVNGNRNHHPPKKVTNFPIGSMYGIYANIGGILMVNVTIYSIHGSYGFWRWFDGCCFVFSDSGVLDWCSSPMQSHKKEPDVKYT